MEKVTARIPANYLKIIDMMVDLGFYKNRDTAIEAAVTGLIRKESGKHQ